MSYSTPNGESSKHDSGDELLERVKGYNAAGIAVTPVRSCSKAAFLNNWSDGGISYEEWKRQADLGYAEWTTLNPTKPAYPPYNIGALLGEVSGGLTDVDIEHADIARIAHLLLPETEAVFGRRSALNSHWWYYAKLSKPIPTFMDPIRENKDQGNFTPDQKKHFDSLIEVRTSGQTVAPGSTHPSGERVEWTKPNGSEVPLPASVTEDELERGVTLLATASLLGRYWPTDGHNQYRIDDAVAGALLKGGCTQLRVADVLDAIWTFVKGPSGPNGKSLEVVQRTAARIENDEPATAWTRLTEILNETLAEHYGETLGAEPGELITKRLQWWLRAKKQPKAKQRRRKIEFLRFNDLAKRPPPEWTVQDVVESGKVCVLYGDYATYKSFIALDMAISVSLGILAFGSKRVKQGRVLYIAAEGIDAFLKRLRAFEIQRDLSPEQITILHAADSPLVFLEWPISFYDSTAVEELCQALVNEVGDDFALVIIDTLARNSVGAEENSNPAMTVVINNIQDLVRSVNASALAIHHVNRDKGAFRGASAILGNADSAIEVVKNLGGECVRLRTNKQKDEDDKALLTLKRYVIDVGEAFRRPNDDPAKMPSSLAFITTTDDQFETAQENTNPHEGKAYYPAAKALEELCRKARGDRSINQWVADEATEGRIAGFTNAEWQAATGEADSSFVRHRKQAIDNGLAVEVVVGKDRKFRVPNEAKFESLWGGQGE